MDDLAKARMELEELYLGIPDDSVNLTFQDLADMKQKANTSDNHKKKPITNMEPVQEAQNPKQASALTKLPSLDFSRGLQAAKSDHSVSHFYHHQHLHHNHNHNHNHNYYLEHGYEDDDLDSDMEVRHHHHRHGAENMHKYGGTADHHRSHIATSPRVRHTEFSHGLDKSMVSYDDVSGISGISMASTYPAERGQMRRPGIPHSNICTICSTYTYIFRHRCLVCGRVYCRQCVFMGMGEMTEGRKCVLCLGKRFSQRYIKRAGKMGCCSRYPSSVKQAELKWAERGPRRSGERAYGRSSMMSRSRSPVNPTPTRSNAAASSTTPSFVASSPAYSPYTPRHHHLPI